jgi:hypothetical protein
MEGVFGGFFTDSKSELWALRKTGALLSGWWRCDSMGHALPPFLPASN